MQAKAAPANDFEVGKVRLPHLVWTHGLGVELARCLHHHVCWAGNKVMGLQQSVNRGLSHKVTPLIGEPHRQFTR